MSTNGFDFNHFINEFMDKLPNGLAELPNAAKANLRTALLDALSQLNVVTREEFDIQTKVLMKSRAMLQALEQRVAALEQ